MGKEGRKRRQFIIKLKQKRREKIKKLKQKYALAKSEAEKKAILEKALKIRGLSVISTNKFLPANRKQNCEAILRLLRSELCSIIGVNRYLDFAQRKF
ncbi:MAG: hypothetical protein ACK4NX_03020 [Candidatus Paceibacteria bacterium]